MALIRTVAVVLASLVVAGSVVAACDDGNAKKCRKWSSLSPSEKKEVQSAIQRGEAKTVVFGGCCKKTTWSSMMSGHKCSREMPPDIENLAESSIVRQKYWKMFRIIPKPIRNWQDKKYKERRRYMDSEHWAKARAALAAKVKNMHGKMDREPAVSEEDVMRLADEMVTYGRGFVRGSFPEMPTFLELAEMYGFTEVAKFLKKALDVDRFRHTGMAVQYGETDEFRDFDALAGLLNPSEWKEYRQKWQQLNQLYENNPKRKK
jgi:hypothetical protein